MLVYHRFARSTDELATAPLYRRDAFGHRRDFIDRPGNIPLAICMAPMYVWALIDNDNDNKRIIAMK